MIPKIIHQMWIGNKEPPDKMMNTWKSKHPEYEYILWNENEIKNRNMIFRSSDKINKISSICGKVDIMRWEILFEYGGIFIDADSMCIEPLDELIENSVNMNGFASFENENCRKGLVSNGTVGFAKNHHLCNNIIEHILNDEMTDHYMMNYSDWYSVGPVLLTRILTAFEHNDFHIFPSYYFLPEHFTGNKYIGHRKVYAFQAWGSTNNLYDDINSFTLPQHLSCPNNDKWISILICSFNTPRNFLTECLDSIADQIGYFGIELVWINDGSSSEHSAILEEELRVFEKNTRFTKIVHKKLDVNKEFNAISVGLNVCSQSLIFLMDSYDTMVPHRLLHQYTHMIENPDLEICSSGIRLLKLSNNSNDVNFIHDVVDPSVLTPTALTNEFLVDIPSGIMNRSSLCFRKESILSLEIYNVLCDDLEHHKSEDLELHFLKKNGFITNIPEILVHCRIHNKQSTENR